MVPNSLRPELMEMLFVQLLYTVWYTGTPEGVRKSPWRFVIVASIGQLLGDW